MALHEPPRERSDQPRASYWTTLRGGLRIAVEQPAVRYQVLFGAVTQLYPFMITFAFFQPYATEVGLPIWALGPLALVMRGGEMVGSMLAHRVSTLGARYHCRGASGHLRELALPGWRAISTPCCSS